MSVSFLPFLPSCVSFFFFNDTATTEIYTLSLHDALPIFKRINAIMFRGDDDQIVVTQEIAPAKDRGVRGVQWLRSEEHTSELQSHLNLVCRLLLEKKNSDQLAC